MRDKNYPYKLMLSCRASSKHIRLILTRRLLSSLFLFFLLHDFLGEYLSCTALVPVREGYFLKKQESMISAIQSGTVVITNHIRSDQRFLVSFATSVWDKNNPKLFMTVLSIRSTKNTLRRFSIPLLRLPKLALKFWLRQTVDQSR